jgi:hypothetical protein
MGAALSDEEAFLLFVRRVERWVMLLVLGHEEAIAAAGLAVTFVAAVVVAVATDDRRRCKGERRTQLTLPVFMRTPVPRQTLKVILSIFPK